MIYQHMSSFCVCLAIQNRVVFRHIQVLLRNSVDEKEIKLISNLYSKKISFDYLRKSLMPFDVLFGSTGVFNKRGGTIKFFFLEKPSQQEIFSKLINALMRSYLTGKKCPGSFFLFFTYFMYLINILPLRTVLTEEKF